MSLIERPGLRAPFLAFGLGAVAGGLEMVKLAATLKLSVSFGEASGRRNEEDPRWIQ